MSEINALVHAADERDSEELHIGSLTDGALGGDAVFEAMSSGSWSFGPLEVKYNLSGSRVSLEVLLAGIKIGSGTLDSSNSQLCVSANALLAKVKLCVKADFGKKELSVNGELCTRKFPSGWSCRSFNQRILAW
jgi:hypothetical protein